MYIFKQNRIMYNLQDSNSNLVFSDNPMLNFLILKSKATTDGVKKAGTNDMITLTKRNEAMW